MARGGGGISIDDVILIAVVGGAIYYKDEILAFLRKGLNNPPGQTGNCPAGQHEGDEGGCVPDTPGCNKTCDPGQTLDSNCNCVGGGTVPIPAGAINVSAKWRNGHARSFTGFDPDDHNVEVRADGGTAVKIDGKGNATVTGDRRRLYCYYKNYNAQLLVTLIPNFKGSGDDASLKMRSRHNEGNPNCNGGGPLLSTAFGGYGFSVNKSGWDA